MKNRTTRTLNWLIALLGVWELISPWVLGFSFMTAAMVDAVVVGGILIIFGVWSALARNAGAPRTLDWLNALLGIWLIIAPFVLGFAGFAAAEISSIIVGVITLIFGIWGAVAAGRYAQSRAEPYGRTAMNDNQLQHTVKDRLVQDPRVDASKIDVVVNNGDVTLKGTVPTEDEKCAAEDDTQEISGVRHVTDNLRVTQMGAAD